MGYIFDYLDMLRFMQGYNTCSQVTSQFLHILLGAYPVIYPWQPLGAKDTLWREAFDWAPLQGFDGAERHQVAKHKTDFGGQTCSIKLLFLENETRGKQPGCKQPDGILERECPNWNHRNGGCELDLTASQQRLISWDFHLQVVAICHRGQGQQAHD